jgi:NitT/TauT family transport system substrate-binding protein
MPIERSRRHFLIQLGVAGIAGVGGLAGARFGVPANSFAAESPPQVTTITIEKAPSTCVSPQYMAEDLLRAEGFTEIRYQAIDSAPASAVARDQLDWDMDFALEVITAVDNGAALTAVAATHIGCYQLMAHDHVRSIAGLKGRTVVGPPAIPHLRNL